MKMIANYPVRNSGKKVVTDESFESDDQDLIDCGAARLASSDIEDEDAAEKIPPSESGTSETTGGGGVDASAGGGATELTDAERAGKIRTILLGWVEKDPDLNSELYWTKKGTPKNLALNKELKLDVTNAEVEPIWAEISAALTPAKDG